LGHPYNPQDTARRPRAQHGPRGAL